MGKLCSGIVSDLYIPPAPVLDASLAPLLPPYVTQSILEAILQSITDVLPRYIESDCLVANRALLCTSLFQTAYASEVLNTTYGTVYVPSFPHKSVCEAYGTQCAALAALNPAATVDCDSSIGTLALYPNTSQV